MTASWVVAGDVLESLAAARSRCMEAETTVTCGQDSRTTAGGHAMVCWMKLDVAKGCSMKIREMQGEQAT